MLARHFLAPGLVTLTLGANLFGQSATTHPGTRAVELGHQGLELYQAGRFAEAYDKFEAAEAVSHSPVFLLYMARSKRNLGRLLEARATFDRVEREGVSEGTPGAWKQAFRDATAEREALLARISTVRITFRGGTCDGARVTIDDRPVSCSVLEQDVELDPGRHSVGVDAEGAKPFSQMLDLAEGEKRKTFELVVPEAVRTPVPSPPEGLVAPPSPSLLPAAIAFGVGAVGLGVGTVTFLAARQEASEVKEGCVGNLCLASDEPKARSALALADVATTAFIAGGVGVAAGVGLLLFRPSPSSKTPVVRGAGRGPNAGPTLTTRTSLVVWPGSIGVSGTF